jgi:hypothetical protein
MLFAHTRRKQARARYDTMRDELLEEDELDEHGGRRQAEEPFSEIMINQVPDNFFTYRYRRTLPVLPVLILGFVFSYRYISLLILFSWF